MKTFRKVALVDDCGLVGDYRKAVLDLSREPVDEPSSDPADDAEIIRRIGDADCVLVSWRTRIGDNVLRQCPSIGYVGMCCSLYDEASANVDIATARDMGMIVKGVRDYGDEGTVEFIFAQLINLYKGIGPRRWGDEPVELGGKRLGVIGLGTLGGMVAHMALHFGMKVAYHSRSRKYDREADGILHMDLNSLLASSDVVSLHLPRNAMALGARELGLMRDGTIFINTSLGRPFDAHAFVEWTRRAENNLGVFDQAGAESLVDVPDIPEARRNILLYPRSSGFTAEAKERLTRKVYENMKAFLATVCD